MKKIEQDNTFYISNIFKGEFADNAEMKTKDLIKSIEGFEESIRLITKNIYGKECNIDSRIKAPSKGSYELHYLFQLVSVAPLLLGNQLVGDISNVVSFIYEVIKQVGNNKVQNVKELDNGSLNIEHNNGSIVVNNYNVQLNLESIKNTANNDDLRKSITKSLTPITNNSASEVIYKGLKDNKIAEINRDNYTNFAPLDEKMTETEKEMELLVIGVNFDNTQWRFEDRLSNEKFSAPIKDDDFQKKIAEGESFHKGDSIIADVYIHYSDKDSKNNKYKILKVIDHIVAPQQHNLPK